MKYIVKRDVFRRIQYDRQEVTGLLSKSVLRSSLVSLLSKEQVRRRGSYRFRVRNRCNLTGRGKSIKKFFGLSRMKILEMSRNGELVGCRKGTW